MCYVLVGTMISVAKNELHFEFQIQVSLILRTLNLRIFATTKRVNLYDFFT
jgi:hypothetical protein